MHICFVIGAMNYSGAEKVLSLVSEGLYDLGNRVSVILLEQEYDVNTVENKLNTYGAKSNGGKIKRILYRWKNIRKIIADIRPDIVVSFGSVCNVNTIPSLIGMSTPLVIAERNDPNYDPRKKSEKFIRWLLYRFADGYVFQTNKIKDYFSHSIQKKATVIANPIPKTDVSWSLSNATKSIATVARLDDYQKDHIIMFEAFEKFSLSHPEYTLNVYGGGPDKDRYDRFIKERGLSEKIILHGKTTEPLEKIVSSEIFLLTSKYEGMPNALMEALSVGMPCISTDCGGGGAKMLINLTNSGLLVQVGDVEEIVDALEKLSSDDNLKCTFSQNALTINQELSVNKISEQWNEYLRSKLN